MKSIPFAVLLSLSPVAISSCTAAGLPDLPARISRAEWLWSAADKSVSTGICARCAFEVKGEVKKARFWTIVENGPRDFYVNGQEVRLSDFPEFHVYRSHERGYGADITKRLVPGKNVIAYRIRRSVKDKYLGFIMRGEIEYADGRVQNLASGHEDFRVADAPEPNWTAIGFDDGKWPQATALGDVRLTPWSNYGNIPAIYCTKEELVAFTKASSAGYPETRILAEPETPAIKIVKNGNMTGVSVNGEVYAPFVKNPNDNGSPARDAGELTFARTGIKFLILRLGDCYRTKAGGFDYTELDAKIRRLLAIYPDAYLIFGYWTDITELHGWLDRNPDELVEYADPSDKYGKEIWLYFAQPAAPSFASAAYRQEVCRLVEAFGEYASKQSWGRRVAGLRIGYGPSSDGMPWGCHRMPDIGKRMTEAFRRFLTAKYGTDAALQAAWEDNSVTLATAKCPDKATRIGTGGWLRDAADARDRRTLDYYAAYHKEFTDFIRTFGRAVHKALPGRLAGAYHGYTLLPYTPEGTTACYEDLLASSDIDFLWSTNPDYSLLNNQHYTVHSPYHRFTKLASMEGDIRTHNNPHAETQWKTKTPDETRSSVTKEITTSILNGCGFHFAITSGSNERSVFAIPEVMEPLKRGIEIWHDAFRNPPKPTADVAVVVDTRVFWNHGSSQQGKSMPFVQATGMDLCFEIAFTGYAAETIDVEEYLETADRYKAAVFMDAWAMDAKTVAAVKAKALRAGRTAVWCYAPGLATERGFSDASMRKLTGLDLVSVREERPFRAVYADGTAAKLPRLPSDFKLTPRVRCEDATAERLGTYADDRTVAFARKTLANGATSVFVGFPMTRVSAWAEIFAKAGCHAYAPQGYHVRATDRYLQVVSCRNGRLPPQGVSLDGQLGTSADIPVRLPRKVAKLTDAFTGEVVATDADAFTLHAENPHTWFLEIGE